MPDATARPLVLASVLLSGLGLPATARAELPKPADFSVEYFVTDEAGESVRAMSPADRSLFLNRARCECGQQVGVKIEMVNPSDDPAEALEAFIGTMCAVAETALAGESRRCGFLARDLIPNWAHGITAAFHPVFLAHGLEPSSPTREIGDPAIQVAGGCDGAGEAGLWMCEPNENGQAGCQEDEFFLGAGDALSNLSGVPALQFDYEPPLVQPEDLSVEPGNGSVLLSWEVPAWGDIAGLRVLCEEADGGASAGLAFPAPDLTAKHVGTHYFTADNLCGGEPFSTVQFAAPEVPDPNTCGNGVLEPGEACDDGPGNAADGLCDPACNLRVSPDLYVLDWDRVCSDHVNFGETSVGVGGLKNGTAYNFVLVAYDAAGNPRPLTQVVTATPDASLPDLAPEPPESPESLEAQGCACSTGPEGHGLIAMSLGTMLVLGRRRRTRSR